MDERFLRASWFVTAMLFAATLCSIAGAAKEEVGSSSDSGDPADAPVGTAHGPATAAVVDVAGQRQNRVTKKHTPAASAPHRFINTFVIRIGGQKLKPGEGALLAKFDMVMCNRFHYDDIDGNTWQTLKAMNSDIEIYLYISGGGSITDTRDASPVIGLNGIGRYNVSRGHSMGSLNGDHPEFFLLDKNGKRIRRTGWLLDFGSSDFQKYTLEVLKSDILERPWAADGVWFDHCTSVDGTRVEGMEEVPAAMGRSAKSSGDMSWVEAMNSYVDAMSKGLHAQGSKGWFNRGVSRNQNGYDAWIALDSMPNPPDAALDEAGLAVKYGTGDVQFYREAAWKRQIEVLKNIKNYRVCMLSTSDLEEGESGLDNHKNPVTFHDVLWFAIGSYLLGKNEVNDNSYLGLSNNYNKVEWYDEFDTKHLDLGPAVATYQVTKLGATNVYWREFQRGYVYVNPTPNDVRGMPLHQPCKQLNHDNFKGDPSTLPSVARVDLQAHRAAILLKHAAK